jgi:hypothetical protein
MLHVPLLVIVCSVTSVLTSTISDIDKLYTDLLSGYNKNTRPPKDQSVTIVNSSFNLVSIKDFDQPI